MQGVGHDVEFVEGEVGIGERAGHPLDEGRQHGDRGRSDGQRITAMGPDLMGHAVNGLGGMLFDDGDDGTPRAGVRDCDRVMPLSSGGFVYGEPLTRQKVLLGDGEIEIVLAMARGTVEAHPRQARHRPERHLRENSQAQDGEERRDTGEFIDEGGLSLAGAPTWFLEAGKRTLRKQSCWKKFK